MKNQIIAVLFLSIGFGCSNHQEGEKQRDMIKAPKAKKVPFEINEHGDTRIDNYYWMRDMDRKDPEILAHLESENAYTKSMLAHTQNLQKELFNELKGRIKQRDESVPVFYDGFHYFTRYENGQEHPIYCRKKESLKAKEQIMLDVNALAKDHSYYQVSGNKISTNNKILAFGEDTLSRRIYTIRFKNLDSDEFLRDRIENTTGNFAWANDNKTLFYTKRDDVTLRAYKVFKHKLGTDQQEDEEIFYEKDETFNVSVGKFKSKKWLYIHSGSTVSDEYQIVDADNSNEPFKMVQARERDLEYGLAHLDEHFYILTNKDDAVNFKLMKTYEEKTEKENWKEIIPHRETVLLEDIDVFKNYLVLSEKSNAQNALRVISWDKNQDYKVPFEEEAFSVGTSSNPEFNTTKLRFVYTSMTTPSSVFEFDMESKERLLLKEQEVLGGFDRENYTSERLWVTARDGVNIPISLVYHKDTKPNKNTPLLLYGYGSYGITIDPSFSPSRLSLLDRGFVFCIAHIRGSQMMGRTWYENGKMLNKINTFNDFIDCANHLIEKEYTSSDHLYALGGSAGGLLMGAVINMAPELWNGVIAAVPFVDVVTNMLDEIIPLTTGEFDEWGNPKNSEFYHYIKSYSPIDNIEAKNYPHLLVTTGLHDSQVQYWEPAKWVAKLREFKTDDNMLLFNINMDYGHSGASGRFEVYKEIALDYAFLLDLESQKSSQ
ncbi:MAG: S9 family peptidase [Salibacteraceae bacterium]